MKAKLFIIMSLLVLLAGCCTNGCTGWGDGCHNNCYSRCGGCDVGYWSTSCPTPNTGGASEAAFTDIGNVCTRDVCARDYYAECNSHPCRNNCAYANW